MVSIGFLLSSSFLQGDELERYSTQKGLGSEFRREIPAGESGVGGVSLDVGGGASCGVESQKGKLLTNAASVLKAAVFGAIDFLGNGLKN